MDMQLEGKVGDVMSYVDFSYMNERGSQGALLTPVASVLLPNPTAVSVIMESALGNRITCHLHTRENEICVCPPMRDPRDL